MNIPSLQTTDPAISPKTEFGSIRRIKRSISLKKSDLDIIDMSKSNSQNSPKVKPRTANDMNGKRVENIADLRKIHECLRKAFNDPTKEIVLVGEDELKVMPNKDQYINSEITQRVIQYIYQKILRAMTSQIYHFFDDKGYAVSLNEIDKLANKKYANLQNLTKKSVQNELNDYYEGKRMFFWGDNIGSENEYINMLMHLPLAFYNENENSTKNKTLCLNIFQKLYPLGAILNNENIEIPVISPIMFICSYKEFVTTEELFEVALKAISLPEKEMPYMQKLRILNFIRLWLSSHFYQDEEITRHMKAIIGKILTIGFASEKLEFLDLCHEICFLLEQHEMACFEIMAISPTKTSYDIRNMLQIEQGKTSNYINFLHILSNDFKFLSGQAAVNVTTKNLFNEKSVDDTQCLYNKIVNFGVQYFIDSLEPMLKERNPKAIKERLQHFFTLFIDLGYELVRKHDYVSSCAIFNLLNNPELNGLLMIPEGKQVRGSLSKNKKHTILKSLGTEHKLQEMSELFSVNINFEFLRKIMKECQELDLSYVPLFAPLKNDIIHKLIKIESSFEEDSLMKINSEKIKFISDIKWETNQLLESIRENFKTYMLLKTDIEFYLVIKDNSEKLTEIYTQIKLILSGKG